MSENWTSVETLKKYYKLDNYDQENLIKKLKEKRNGLHPDKTGGDFKNNTEKREYLELKEAIKFVKKEIDENQKLVPVSQVTELVRTISTELSRKNEPSLVEVQNSLKNEFRTELSHKYKGFKIGSGIFAGISAYLFTQAKTLSEHPFLKDLFGTREGLIVITSIFITFSLIFLVTWIREKQEESTVNYLLTDDALRKVYNKLRGTEKLFSIREIENILSYLRTSDYEHDRRNHVNSIAINKIAKLQLSKLIEKDLITQVDKKGFDEVYTLNS